MILSNLLFFYLVAWSSSTQFPLHGPKRLLELQRSSPYFSKKWGEGSRGEYVLSLSGFDARLFHHVTQGKSLNLCKRKISERLLKVMRVSEYLSNTCNRAVCRINKHSMRFSNDCYRCPLNDTIPRTPLRTP